MQISINAKEIVKHGKNHVDFCCNSLGSEYQLNRMIYIQKVKINIKNISLNSETYRFYTRYSFNHIKIIKSFSMKTRFYNIIIEHFY